MAHISDKEFPSRLYKIFNQTDNTKMNHPVKQWAKT